MFGERKKWELLVKVHNYAKAIILKAEEVDPDHEFYYPPLIQQRDALDHIMRAAFAWLFPERMSDPEKESPPDPAEYASKQIDKALGHAYRVLFDAADWLSIIYRERIREYMSSYSPATVYAILPQYRASIEPRIEEICFKIAELRKAKDIGNTNAIVEGVDSYISLIDELEQYLATIRAAKGQLDSVEFGHGVKV